METLLVPSGYVSTRRLGFKFAQVAHVDTHVGTHVGTHVHQDNMTQTPTHAPTLTSINKDTQAHPQQEAHPQA